MLSIKLSIGKIIFALILAFVTIGPSFAQEPQKAIDSKPQGAQVGAVDASPNNSAVQSPQQNANVEQGKLYHPGLYDNLSDEDVGKAIANLESQLVLIEKNNQVTDAAKSSVDLLERELENLRRIQLLIEQRGQAAHDLEGLNKQLDDLENQAKQPIVSSELANSTKSNDDTSFAELEKLRDEESVLQLAMRRSVTEQEALLRTISALKTDLEDKAKEERRLKESTPDGQDIHPLLIAQLETRVVSDDLALQTINQTKAVKEGRIIETKIQRLQRQIAFREKLTKLSEAFLRKKQQELESSEQELRERERAARRDLPRLERLWDIVRKRQLGTDNNELLNAELDAKRFAKEEIQTSLEILGKQISLIADLRALWDRRYQLASNNASLRDVSQWKKDIDSKLTSLETAIELATTRQTEIRKTGFAIETKLDDLRNDSAELARFLADQSKALRKTEQDYFSYISWLEENYRLFLRFRMEVKAYQHSYNFSEKLSEYWSAIVLTWNYEIFVIDDRPITISKIVLALALFAIGLRLSRYLSKQIGLKILPHFNKAQGAAAALEALSFYFLVVFFALFALRVVNVPLTVFTVLGGALAIGVGFGSQNIVNNFISGIILLVEQPIRTGDLIELGSYLGHVQHIGLRSTILKTGKNTEIIIPNSSFLEKQVVNWTRVDDRISSSLQIGVAYGTKLEVVRGLLLRVAREHEKVLADPEPVVYISDFGTIAVVLELQFWLHLFSCNGAAVSSDLRERIYNLLLEHNISIPHQVCVSETWRAPDGDGA